MMPPAAAASSIFCLSVTRLDHAPSSWMLVDAGSLIVRPETTTVSWAAAGSTAVRVPLVRVCVSVNDWNLMS